MKILHVCVFRFLSMLEEEIYGEKSPIWEADFTMPASDGTQMGHQPGGETELHIKNKPHVVMFNSWWIYLKFTRRSAEWLS